METFKQIMKVLWVTIWGIFQIGIFAWCAIDSAKKLSEYFETDEI